MIDPDQLPLNRQIRLDRAIYQHNSEVHADWKNRLEYFAMEQAKINKPTSHHSEFSRGSKPTKTSFKNTCSDCGETFVTPNSWDHSCFSCSSKIKTCPDCGKDLYGGYCLNCKLKENEEHKKSMESFKSKYSGLNLLSSDSEDESENKKNESCCYITSACLDDLAIPRTSPEMRAMKTLTKNHILKSFGGIKDYVRYGMIAPPIVESIRAREDSKEIWQRVYACLGDVVQAVSSGNYEQGYQKYKDLVLGLESKFVPK